MIYRLKKGTKGNCHLKYKDCCACLRIKGDFYVSEKVDRKGYDFETESYDCYTGCGTILRHQLVPVITKKEKARYLLNKL
jgi:hypothetical protein